MGIRGKLTWMDGTSVSLIKGILTRLDGTSAFFREHIYIFVQKIKHFPLSLVSG